MSGGEGAAAEQGSFPSPRVALPPAGRAPEEEALGEITVPAAPVNAALSALLSVEAGIQRAVTMPFGSSLLCLARKPA